METRKRVKPRTIYKIDPKEFIKYAGRLAQGGLQRGHGNAINMVKDCMYAQLGQQRRKLTDVEAAQQINKAF